MALTPLGAGIVTTVLTGGTVGLVLAWVAWRRPERPGGDQFVLFATVVGLWNLARGLQYVTGPGTVGYALFELANVFALFAGFAWVAFALHYSGRGNLLSGWRRVVFWGEPAVYGSLLLTRPFHELLGEVPESVAVAGLSLFDAPAAPLVLFQTSLSLLLTVGGFVLVGAFALRTREGHRKQAAAVLAGSAIVFLTNVAYQWTGGGIHPAFDPTSVVVLGMVVVIGVALFRYDLFSVTPLATDALFEEMSDPVLVLDEEDAVVETNDAADRLVGQAVGRPIGAVAPAVAAVLDGEATVVDDEGRGGTSGEGPSTGREVTRPGATGAVESDGGTVAIEGVADRDRTYDVGVSSVEDAYGRVRGRVVVLRDVTVRKRRQRELERKNERLDQFARVVSHDLRNPLSIAMGHTRQARERGSVESLDVALSAMEDMEELVDDVLRLAREGRTIDETHPVDVAAVADDAWSVVETRDATLRTAASDRIEADPDRVRELLGNLFRNAVEHGGPAVTVRVGVEDGVLYVEDDGTGIPEADRDRVFESGYTGGSDGTGIGLAIVETIAEAHGWEPTATEGPDGGARFEFSGVDVSDR